jgi:hypothetical protein
MEKNMTRSRRQSNFLGLGILMLSLFTTKAFCGDTFTGQEPIEQAARNIMWQLRDLPTVHINEVLTNGSIGFLRSNVISLGEINKKNENRPLHVAIISHPYTMLRTGPGGPSHYLDRGVIQVQERGPEPKSKFIFNLVFGFKITPYDFSEDAIVQLREGVRVDRNLLLDFGLQLQQKLALRDDLQVRESFINVDEESENVAFQMREVRSGTTIFSDSSVGSLFFHDNAYFALVLRFTVAEFVDLDDLQEFIKYTIQLAEEVD